MNETKVLEVERKEGKVLKVVIESGPFQMTFSKKGKKVSLVSFKRFDSTQDEADWIPRHYFLPAIQRARAIFSSSKKKKKYQARLL